METNLTRDKFWWTLFLLLGSLSLHAQVASDPTDALVNQLTGLWKQHVDLTQGRPPQSTDQSVFELFTPGTYTDSSALVSNSRQMAINAAKAKVLHGDYGLSGTANYLENINPGPGEFEDNLVYDRRLQASLSMDLLKSGLWSNRIKAQALLLQNEILQGGAAQVDRRNYGYQRNLIIYQFNLQKLQLLQDRATVLEGILEAADKLYAKHLMTRNNYLDLKSREAENEQLLLMYTTYNQWFEAAKGKPAVVKGMLPAIRMNFNVLRQIQAHDTGQAPQTVNQELIDLESHWAHDVAVRPFVRYNYYDLTGTTNARSFISAGLSVGAPIPFNRQAKTELIAIENAPAARMKTIGGDLELDLLNHYYEFMYKWKQYVATEEKQKAFGESIRKSQASLGLDPELFQPISALKHLDNWLQTQHELIDIRQQMYLKVLKVLELQPTHAPKDLIVSAAGSNLHDHRDWVSQVYIWSAAFEELSPGYLKEFVRFRNIETAYLAFRRSESNLTEKLDVAKLIQKKGGQVHVMIGYNGLLNKNASQYFLEVLDTSQWRQMDGIHLDVEPHTFDDYHAKKDHYLELLSDLYKQASAFCEEFDLELSASVPFHYPPAFYRNNLPLVDHFVLMAYENVKFDYLKRKTIEVTGGQSGFKLALRTDDFNSTTEISALMEQLGRETSITQYVIHDLTSVVKLEETELPGK